MCRLWATEAYNPCMPGPATATVYGFIVLPFMSSPAGEGGQQFRKFTVYAPTSGREIMRVLTCVSAHCMHMYPDQLVRAQPHRKQCQHVCRCVRGSSGRSASPRRPPNHSGGSFSLHDPGIKQVEQQLGSTFFMRPSPYVSPSLSPLTPSFFFTLPGGGV